jgi:hypothetical protein
MVPVDEGVHFKHVQVVIRDIKLQSAEKSRDVENEPIFFFFFKCKWANFRKNSKGMPWSSTFETPSHFIEDENFTLMT